MEKITIVTPCTRIENLYKIANSLQTIPKKNRRWLVIFDLPGVPDNIPKEGEYYAMWKKGSVVGNAQRNYALDKITEGWIYFNDDDTIIHKDLWKNIKDLDNDFISFMQENKEGKLRLQGDKIELNHIDSHNFIFSFSLLGNTRMIENKYNADGIFAEEIKKKSINSFYIPKVLSTYNALRNS